MQEAVAAAKSLLRHAVALRRDSRSAAARAANDHARFEQAVTGIRRWLPRVETVAAYLSTGSEPGTLELVGWLASQEIAVMLPVLTHPDGAGRREPAWAPYAGPDLLRVGAFGILEPTTPVLGDGVWGDVDLIVCSGLAANPAGDRLGRGGGWYDRALGGASPQTPVWVLLNDDEVMEMIPTDSWDRRVNLVVTPTRLVQCGTPPLST